MGRKSTVQYSTIDISVDAALGTAVLVEGYDEGYLVMPAAWTAADIGFKVCDTKDGTYSILRDTAGVIVDIEDPTVDIAHVLPEQLFNGTIWIKPWSKNATPATETKVDQTTADRVLKFVMR